ncbi:5-methylcytosine restriction system specificity protein McrC [Arcticibacter eurypsychrophilus]|uniref:5-methylcytosine restriction system specificity protein McrC n=1 Tax=Arcticibacter eurypsychrophilus TaxID=1434752 RepID=UPI00084D6551|nr:hypothetical protein [Arcticibacter eurypsychrophilus]
MNKVKQFDYWEHLANQITLDSFSNPEKITNRFFGSNPNLHCYKSTQLKEYIKIEVGYYIGVDWLIEGDCSIVVAPKLDTRIEVIKGELAENGDEEIDVDEGLKNNHDNGANVAIDYIAMLNQCISVDFLYKEIDKLIYINWNAKEVPINQEHDWLSPLLIVQFLNTLKRLVAKGLKKSYYKVSQNLNCKIKGKVLIGQNLKQNVFKNKFTTTLCQFEEFGIDSFENRLLKKALQFSHAYIDNHKKVFNDSIDHFENLLNYCRPAFDAVSNEVNILEVKDHIPNPFFAEYKDAIKQAKLILKRYAYSITNTNKQQLTTPPYWIDMPKLFELYTYNFLRNRFPNKNDLNYHTKTYGNELDFLVNSGSVKMVIDAKYKPLYIYGKDHNDIRQVSGYARLDKIFKALGLEEDRLIDCLIIYPDIQNGYDLESFKVGELTSPENTVKGYRRVYKIGIKLPVK